MNNAYFAKGTATITLQGYARIIDADGNRVKELDLASIGEFEVPFDSTNYCSWDDQCGLSFRIDNIFLDEKGNEG